MIARTPRNSTVVVTERNKPILSDEVVEWLQENCRGDVEVVNDSVDSDKQNFLFEYKKDAVLFTLRWI